MHADTESTFSPGHWPRINAPLAHGSALTISVHLESTPRHFHEKHCTKKPAFHTNDPKRLILFTTLPAFSDPPAPPCRQGAHPLLKCPSARQTKSRRSDSRGFLWIRCKSTRPNTLTPSTHSKLHYSVAAFRSVPPKHSAYSTYSRTAGDGSAGKINYFLEDVSNTSP